MNQHRSSLICQGLSSLFGESRNANSPNSCTSIQKWADFVLRTELFWALAVYLPLLFIPSFVPSLNGLGIIGLSIALVPWGLRRWRRGYFTRRSAFDLPFILFLISAAVGLAFAKLPAYGLSRLWVLAGCALFFYAVNNMDGKNAQQRYLLLVIALGFGITLVLMTQTSDLAQFVWEGELLPQLRPLFEWLVELPKIQMADSLNSKVNRNSVAGVSMLILPLMWPLALSSSRRVVKLVAILGASFIVLTLAVSGWVTAMIALGAGWTLIVIVGTWKTQAKVAILGATLAVLILILLLLGYPLQNYVADMIGARLDLWHVALRIIQDFPLSGIGLGRENWLIALPAYPMPMLPALSPTIPCLNVPACWFVHAHNFYIQNKFRG